jgi:hypothetical protein
VALKNLCLCALQTMIIFLLACGCNLAACDQAQSAETKKTNSLSKQAIRNSNCVVFNLGDGPNHVVSVHQGTFKNDNEKGSVIDEFFAQGKLDGEAAAVVFVAWNTGGSGWFEELALFRLRKGNACCTGIYSLEDRASIKKLSIQNNEVVLDWLKHADTDAASSPSKHEVLRLKSSQFEKCGL